MSTLSTDATIIWRPNPGQQTFALTRQEREILYGGARGGGKTDASIAFLSRWTDNPKYRFLVIRRNSDDLADWISRAKQRWSHLGAVFSQRKVVFPSGAEGHFGHLFDDNAYERYQGHEYQKMVIEELTHIPTEDLYEKLIMSCRSTVDGLSPQIFSTTNPGNIGHIWVSKRFRTKVRSQHNRPFVFHTKDDLSLTRIFIPARVEDNPVLIEKDPGYIAMLDSITDAALRKAWLEGSWDKPEVKGAYYKHQVDEAYAKGRVTVVPHEPNLPVHTWWDIGVDDSTTIGFFQIVGSNEWHLIDYYENSGEGMKHYIGVLDDKRRELGYTYGRHFGPPDIEVREFTSGKTRRESAKELGVTFDVVQKLSLQDGIDQVRLRFALLWIDELKCEGFLEKIPMYRKEWDEKNATFRNNPVHDFTSHAADMLRYWAVTPFARSGGAHVRVHS